MDLAKICRKSVENPTLLFSCVLVMLNVCFSPADF